MDKVEVGFFVTAVTSAIVLVTAMAWLAILPAALLTFPDHPCAVCALMDSDLATSFDVQDLRLEGSRNPTVIA